MIKLGARIKELRKIKGFTQDELGDLIGVKKVSIQKYESGAIVNLKLDTIEKLSEVLEVSPAKLMGWDVEFNSNQLKRNVKLLESIQGTYGF